VVTKYTVSYITALRIKFCGGTRMVLTFLLDDGIRVNGPLRAWTSIGNPIKRREYQFPETLRRDCDEYYVNNYIRWYGTEPFASVNGQIAQLNLWDDHDVGSSWTRYDAVANSIQIIDGFGSYVDEFMRCPVFRGIGGVANKYYLLFQHHLAPPISTYTTGKHTYYRFYYVWLTS
jgi:hypothetical protein